MALNTKVGASLAALLLVTGSLATPNSAAVNGSDPEPDSHAFFIVRCDKPILIERADPIQYVGRAGPHLHTIMGGNAFDWFMGSKTPRESSCTTCQVTQDVSNYWVPTLFFRTVNDTFMTVPQIGGINVYYQERIDWTEYQAGHKIEPFPPGFRMVAGDYARRHFDPESLEHRAIEFVCLHGKNQTESPATHGFPNATCDGGFALRVRFPSCWDGNLDSRDHKSHMAYPARVDSGPCPSTHPRHLPSLMFENIYNVTRFNHLRRGGEQPFVLSHGDPTGYGYYGEFLNGWEVDVLAAALNDRSCGTSSLGDIQECKTLRPFLQSARAMNCPELPTRLPNDLSKISRSRIAPIDKLPGCNPIRAGPDRAEDITDCPEELPSRGHPFGPHHLVCSINPPINYTSTVTVTIPSFPTPLPDFEKIYPEITDPAVWPVSYTTTVTLTIPSRPTPLPDFEKIYPEITDPAVAVHIEEEDVIVGDQESGAAPAFRSTWVGAVIRLMRW